MAITGSCHCGDTRFEVSEAPTSLGGCTCTFCSKRGALGASYPTEQFKLLTKPEHDAVYCREGRVIKHHFCTACGIFTYSESPDWVDFKPDFDHMRIGVNARLFDDFDISALPVSVIDGRNLW